MISTRFGHCLRSLRHSKIACSSALGTVCLPSRGPLAPCMAILFDPGSGHTHAHPQRRSLVFRGKSSSRTIGVHCDCCFCIHICLHADNLIRCLWKVHWDLFDPWLQPSPPVAFRTQPVSAVFVTIPICFLDSSIRVLADFGALPQQMPFICPLFPTEGALVRPILCWDVCLLEPLRAPQRPCLDGYECTRFRSLALPDKSVVVFA